MSENRPAIMQLAFWMSRHAFIVATGFTALLHSTWTLATIFNGMEPVQLSLAWFAWVIPAFVFALSIDVGQIATSADIRNGERTPAKYATFAALAVATYYLQWWYIAAHFPLVVLSAGISQSYLQAAIAWRDFAVWFVPGFLPATTLLYTFSYAKPKRVALPSQRATSNAKPAMARAKPEQSFLATPQLAALPEPVSMTAVLLAKCESCGWESPCETERQRINKLNAHRRFCSANIEEKTA